MSANCERFIPMSQENTIIYEGLEKGLEKTPFPQKHAGLTIVETLASILVLAIATSASFTALTTLNNFAILNRNSVAALALVQDAVEEFLSEPFTSIIPPNSPLSLGNRTRENVPIVIDRRTGLPSLTGNLLISVSDGSLDASGDEIVGRESLRLLRATYTLSYSLRGRTYTVSQSTMRANDQ